MRQFDRHAEAYDAIRGRIVYPESLYARLARECPGRTAALDIGCGNGVSTARLVPWFAHVEGADLGAALIEKARARLPGVTFTVEPAETLTLTRRFDLVTCATAFYWMDRDAVIARLGDWLTPGGLFCAYRYHFPHTREPVESLVQHELQTRWARHRDPRLVARDDTLERLQRCHAFIETRREVEPLTVTLTADELTLFLASTSFVTRYLEIEAPPGYLETLGARLAEAAGAEPLAVTFDLEVFTARAGEKLPS